MDLSRLSSQPRSRAAAANRRQLLADSVEKPGYVVENKGVSKTTGRLWPNVAPAEKPVMDIAASGPSKPLASSSHENHQPFQQKSSVTIQPRVRLHASNGEHKATKPAAARLVEQNRSPVRAMDIAKPSAFASKPVAASAPASAQDSLLTSNPGYTANKVPQLVYSQPTAHSSKPKDTTAKIPIKSHATVAPLVSKTALKEVVHPVSAMGKTNQTVPQLVSKYKQPTASSMPRARSIDGFSAPVPRQQRGKSRLMPIEPVRPSTQPIQVQPYPETTFGQETSRSSGEVVLSADMPEAEEESKRSLELGAKAQQAFARPHLNIKPQQLVVFGAVLIALALGALFPAQAYGQWLIIALGVLAFFLRLGSHSLFVAAFSMVILIFMSNLGHNGYRTETLAIYCYLFMLMGISITFFEVNKKWNYTE